MTGVVTVVGQLADKAKDAVSGVGGGGGEVSSPSLSVLCNLAFLLTMVLTSGCTTVRLAPPITKGAWQWFCLTVDYNFRARGCSQR